MIDTRTDMNVRLVLVLGVRHQMDQLLEARGVAPHYVDGYRVTDMEVMTAAAEATGAARVEVEAALSKVRVLTACCAMAVPSETLRCSVCSLHGGQDFGHALTVSNGLGGAAYTLR